MKKSLLVFLGISNLLLASEFDYGSGTFSMQGGFLGSVSEIDTDISTYTLSTRHANIFGNAFYAYDLTWYDSKQLNQSIHNYNSYVSDLNGLINNTSTSIPAMDYKLQGLDANIKVGYDIIHKDDDNFLGIGALVGISIPWIESNKDSSSDSNSNSGDSIFGEFPDTETKIKTYKVGATVNFQKSLISNKLSFYGTGSYAFQTGSIENDEINSDSDVDGTFKEINLGLYFTPFTEKYKLGFLTLSPRIFATLGYKYTKWEVDDIVINMSGKEINSDILSPFATKFNMDSSVGYFGLGYSF